MKPRINPFYSIVSLASVLVAFPGAAHAADASFSAIQYTNLGWDNNAIWTPATHPGLKGGTGNADTATFASEGSHLITLPSSGGLINIGNVIFGTPATTPNTYIFNSNSLLVSAGGSIANNSSFTGRAAFNSTTTLQGNVSFTGGGATGSSLVFNPVGAAADLGSVALTLNGSNTGTLNIAGGIINGAISQGSGSTLALVKDGTGTWTLNSNNTYGGGTTINGGTLITGTGSGGTPFNTTGAITIGGNATIRTTNNAPADYSSRITINDGATLTMDTGNIAHSWAGILGNSGASNTAGLTKTGIGQLTILPAAGAVQTWKGDTTVNMGALQISAASQTTLTSSNLINGATNLILGGGAAQIVGRANITPTTTTGTSGTNTVTVSSSTGLIVGQGVTSTTAGAIPTGTTVTDISGTTITLSNNLGANLSGNTTSFQHYYSQTFGSTTLNAGISEMRPASSTGINTVSLGSITRDTGALLNIVNATGYTYSTSLADGFVKGVIWSSNDLSRINSGNFTAATYTTQNNASSWIDSGTNYGTNGAVSGTVGTGGPVDINGLKLNHGSSQSFSIDGTLRVNGGIVFGSSIGANASEISGGNLTSTGGELIIVSNNAQNAYGRNTISSTIVDNGGATDLIVHAPANGSTLFLSGNNTYTGNTYIGGNSNGGTGSSITTVGGVSGAKIGSVGKTVYVNGGGAANPLGSVLRVGNGDATGDVLGTIQLDNGRLSLNRNDTFTLTAEVAGTRGGGYISQDNASGNATVKFAAGNNLFAGLRGGASGTLNLTGPGSVNTFGLMAWDSGSLNGATLNFKSGTYYLSGTSNNGNNGNVTLAVDGADVVWGGGRWFAKWGATVNVSSGKLSINSGILSGTDYANTNPLVFNISGTGVFDMAAGVWALSGKADPTSVSATANQTGGEANVGVVAASNVTIGSNANLTIGVANASHASTYNLSGGVLRVANTLAAGGAPTTGSNNFNWIGGRLNARTLVTANLTGNTVANTLVQNGAAAVLSPGDTHNGTTYSGKTDITGDYTLTSGKLAIGIGGTPQANSYHDAPGEYDTVAISGAANLGAGAMLDVKFNNGFVPTNANSFIILTAGSIGGTATFSNLSGGRITLAGGDSFAVTIDATSVVLSDYQEAPGGDDYASWATDNSVTGGPGGDSDNDGVLNLIEYALVDGGERGAMVGDVLTFTKRGAPYGGDISYTIEVSTDLGITDDWDPAPSGVSDTPAAISYSFTPGSPVRNFARLKVVEN